MFKLSKKDQSCLLRIGIGVIIIVILFRLFKNTYRSNFVTIEGQENEYIKNQGIKCTENNLQVCSNNTTCMESTIGWKPEATRINGTIRNNSGGPDYCPESYYGLTHVLM